MKGRKSEIFPVIFANAIPLLGVLFFSWSISEVFWLYWFELLALAAFDFISPLFITKETRHTSFHFIIFQIAITLGYFVFVLLNFPFKIDIIYLLSGFIIFINELSFLIENVSEQIEKNSSESVWTFSYRKLIPIILVSAAGYFFPNIFLGIIPLAILVISKMLIEIFEIYLLEA